MNCFHFSNGEKTGSQSGKSLSTRSNSNRSSNHDKRISEFYSNLSLDLNGRSLGSSQFPSLSQSSNSLRTFTFKELKSATRNFSHAVMIGEGGFGCVYRGTLQITKHPRLSLDVAIKKLNRGGHQGQKEWLTEVDVLGAIEHPNLIKLIGYCAEDDERGIQRLLVYEFMPNRSVQDHLSTRSLRTLSWPNRLRIALGAAHGLTYLHEGRDVPIIFRDLKTSNILLDDHWNAKLSDFGLAREGPIDESGYVSTVVVGTMGYAAPEYIESGHLTAKCDTWSYGVVLFELITGRKPVDCNRAKQEKILLKWIKPYASDSKKFHMIVDPRLEAEYSLKQAIELAAVANLCLIRSPTSRPKMSEVLELVRRMVNDSEIGTQPPLNTFHDENSCGEDKVADLKRRICDLKADEGRWFVWQRWLLKLLRAH